MTTQARTAMRERLREDYRWTPRQREVLDMLAAGRTNGEISEELGVSLAGAKWHVSEIMSKLGAESREEAAEYWRRYNGLQPRFARVFRGLAGATALKWVAGGVGVLVLGGLTLALLVLAQDEDDPSGDEQVQASPTAVPTAGGDNRTGIAEVDSVINAVMSRDRDRVLALLELVPVPCAQPLNPQIMVPCPSDPPGTTQDAFPISGCEDGWTTAQFPWVDSLLMREPEVFGVFRQQPKSAAPPVGLPSGEYVIVWRYGALDTSRGVALEVTDGRIVRETGACGPYPYNLTKDVAPSDYVLFPATGIPTPPPAARVRHLGDLANDRLIDAIIDGDWETLAAAFELFPEPCTTATERGVGSPPACPAGVPDGGTVHTTRISSCEWVRVQNPVEELEWLFEPMFAFDYEVFAAFPPDQAEYIGEVPGGDVVVVIQRIGSTEGSAWHLSDGRIVGLRLGCGGQAAELVEGISGSAFVLPPLN